MIYTGNVNKLLVSSRYIKNTDLHSDRRVGCSRENLNEIKHIQKELFKTYTLAKKKDN